MAAILSRPQWVNLQSAGPINTGETILVTTVPARALAPKGAKPSADTELKIKLNTCSSKFPWSSVVSYIGVNCKLSFHHNDVIMGSMASQIACFSIVYSAVYSGSDQRKYQSPASLAFVRTGIFPAKMPTTRKMFPFDDVVMQNGRLSLEKSRGTSSVNSLRPSDAYMLQ